MRKPTAAYEMALPPKQGNEPHYRWLYRVLREGILEGRLRRGARLPSTRDFASRYKLSRSTIIEAFEMLKAEGYLEGSLGSGTFVSRAVPDELLRASSSGEDVHRTRGARRLSSYAKALQRVDELPQSFKPFRANVPAFDLFPFQTWSKIACKRARGLDVSTLAGCPPEGLRSLREVIADYLNAWRGVRCTPDQVLILSGALEAFDLCIRILLNPGDRVCVEDPGYPDAWRVLEAARACIDFAPVDEEGIQIASLEGARMVYVTPAHQAPLGVTMSLQRRMHLLELAQNADAVIFEDDYDSEYRFSGRPVSALQGLDRHGNVIFAGSFSKVLFQGLRLGYVVLPSDLVPVFAAARAQTIRHSQMLDQLTLRDFIIEGHFGRHIRRMREIYAERLTTLQDEVRKQLGGLLELSPIEAGLQVLGKLREINAADASALASERGIIVTPLDRYAKNCSDDKAILLGFSASSPAQIRHAVRELAVALATPSSATSRHRR